MKRIASALLALALLLSLVGCAAVPGLLSLLAEDESIGNLENTAGSGALDENDADLGGTDADDAENPDEPDDTQPETPALLPEDGTYTTKEDVALYLYQYGRLPENFITKKAAEALGWPGGSLEAYAPGKCIGGSHFGNYEGLLPEAAGRSYTECDIDTLGADSRGAKRIVFSNDGLIYYTEDHYESFELLYGEE